MNMNEISQMARHEVGWRKAHHQNQREELISEMAKLYRLLFNLNYNDALIVVEFRVKAMKFHDVAEEYENQKKQKEADKYWNEVERNFQKHFELLERLRKR